MISQLNVCQVLTSLICTVFLLRWKAEVAVVGPLKAIWRDFCLRVKGECLLEALVLRKSYGKVSIGYFVLRIINLEIHLNQCSCMNNDPGK